MLIMSSGGEGVSTGVGGDSGLREGEEATAEEIMLQLWWPSVPQSGESQ